MIARLLNFSRDRAPVPPLPERPVYAIGDLHGRADLLARRLAELEEGVHLVTLGDYVDRGPDSAGVLRQLMGRPDTTCLMGNHEDMLLRFLDAPDANGPQWLRHGGWQTLASFGVAIPDPADPDGRARAAEGLAEAMGEEMLDWLRNLPLAHQSGNIAFVHAGADPTRAIEEQDPQVLLWGHRGFTQRSRRDGLWIVHGHTVVEQPRILPGRIPLDTGAYATGRLSVALFADGGVRFLP